MTRGVHLERHATDRVSWLQAAVLGANDGIVSTASLIVGVASAAAGRPEVIIAGAAGLVAGAMSMAAGEYVSVSSQADAERADLDRETRELEDDPEFEHRELAEIYVGRGLDPTLADEVARQLMAKDALGTHARDELGITEITQARPLRAAIASALAFTIGAAVPLLVAVLAPFALLGWIVPAVTLVALATLGAAGAAIGGAKWLTGAVRVTFWGAIAMALTAGIGALIGAAV